MRSFLISLLVFGLTINSLAQPGSKRITRAEYISKYKNDAIEEMHRSGVPASITLAQGILESGDGNSPLARYANNHFGIKCHSDWTGKRFIQDDDAKDECFRHYKSVKESFRDHSDFLKKKRYAALFELKITDYKGWAKGLKQAGYATNPKYPQLLIDIIEANNLSQYDHGKGRSAKKDSEKTASTPSRSRKEGSHQVKVHENRIKYIEVKPEDSFESIADEFEMGLWQLYKYNDLSRSKELFDEGILYLQPKRRRAKVEFHELKSGESMWDVSQKYGIKLKKLYKKNRLEEGDLPEPGTKLYLRKKKPR